jgi:hypothetical protein
LTSFLSAFQIAVPREMGMFIRKSKPTLKPAGARKSEEFPKPRRTQILPEQA